MRYTAPISVLLFWCGGLSSLSGQEPLPADSATPLALPGVTVTILRTPLPLARTPYAVSVVSGDAVAGGRPGLALDEALRAVPGVQIDNRYNYALGERISIRGFGARAQFGVRGVRVLVDGIPATFPDGQTSLSHLDMGFLSRVEVVRGPASSIYGSSAGGVIQLSTVEPAPGERIRMAGVTAGSHDLLRGEAAVGATDARGAYLVRVSHQGYGGERDHSTARNLRLHATGRYATGIGDLRVSASAVDYDADNPGSLSAELLAEDRTQAFRNNVLQGTGEEGRQGQVGVSLRRQAGPGELEVALYGIAREVLNPIPASIIDLERAVGGGRAIFQAAGTRGSLALGVEGAVQRDDRRNFANDGGESGSLTLDQRESVDDVGLFAQATVRPLAPLTLLAGLRFDWYRFSADDRFVEGDPDDSGSIRMSHASPSIGAALELDKAASVYANLATAFETPTTTELANRPDGSGGFNPELEPQEILSLEAGLRGGIRFASYELAGYTAEVTNALIPFEVAEMPDRQFFRNAGSARHRGVEAALATTLLTPLSARLAYTFTDARFLSYETDDAVLDGNRVPGISPHRADLVLTLSAGRPFLAVDTRYSSRTPVDDANSAHSPSYFVTDLRLGARGVPFGGATLEPVIGLSNLFDAEYNSSVVVNAFGRRYFEPAPGRAVHVGLRVAL
jgi:iron complex outermembrane receptor protein